MSAVYPSCKQGLLDTGDTHHVDLNTDTIGVILLSGYTYDSSDVTLADVLAGATEIARNASGVSTPTVTNGTFDHADLTFPSVASGSTVSDVVYYKVGASDALSYAICHVDLDSGGSALSLPTNGSDITLQTPAGGVFSL